MVKLVLTGEVKFAKNHFAAGETSLRSNFTLAENFTCRQANLVVESIVC